MGHSRQAPFCHYSQPISWFSTSPCGLRFIAAAPPAIKASGPSCPQIPHPFPLSPEPPGRPGAQERQGRAHPSQLLHHRSDETEILRMERDQTHCIGMGGGVTGAGSESWDLSCLPGAGGDTGLFSFLEQAQKKPH